MPELFDMHCHLLFGVDDGPETMEEALSLLQREYDDGVGTIYLTPHHRKGLFETPAELRQRNFELLRDRAAERFPDLNLRLGCEVHVSMDLELALRDGSGLTMGDTNFVLLEFPEAAGKRYLLERCHAVMSRGYRPILAHAERCDAIRSDLGLLKRLVDMGVYIQMNAGSLTGEDGLAMKWFCRKVMRLGLLHFVGSDAHNLSSRKPNLLKCSRYLERIMGSDYRDQILCRNPMSIIEGSD